MTKYHFYMCDDKVHDNLFLQYGFGLHKQRYKNLNHPLPIRHIVFSNGCSSQCGRTLFYVAHYLSLTKCDELPLGICVQWNHLATYIEKEGGSMELVPL